MATAAGASGVGADQPAGSALDRTQLRHWSVSEVGQWLRAIGPAFAAYTAAFEANAVDGAVLYDVIADATALGRETGVAAGLTVITAFFEALGVASPLHRICLSADVRYALAFGDPPPPAAAAAASVRTATPRS